MRVILYTGKGGVGKTSLAAATAIAAAASGKRTIVVSTDAAHSLGDSFDLELGDEPIKIRENLWAQEISTLFSAEKSWGKVQDYLSALLISQNIKDITADELIIFPGLEELFSLFEILNHCSEGKYDVVIVDCAPTGETLRLLSFPEVLKWWLEKIFPVEKLLLKIARPISKPLFGVPLPGDDTMDSIAELFQQLREMHEILVDEDITSVRIVVNPEKMVIREAERSFMYLNLYGFNTDAVIVNRLLPFVNLGQYFEKWGEVHHNYLRYIKDQFSPVPVFTVPLFMEEVVGFEALDKMGSACFGGKSPEKFFFHGQTQKISKTEDGYVLEMTLPFVEKGDISLSQKGDELTVRLGEYKRNIFLPRKLLGRDVVGAKLEDSMLKIKFGGVRNGGQNM
ncbi:arsenite efflux ATP-binding protein ArsA (TC 3.A.4.1.1) [Desulfotomaculum arcticum]|uniref:arsenite-transporting ATPase n=1 Tax=Desulfotruncus arcticus DSM 17038 TaxID=1121424 RepID=A0A1I2QLI5_9FIRM|nr:TRC40/GET3/ArsA family transport-energizing ATPase [Desulfotruncus arcticus]SFG29234.1 arsenite efflux ATP-binding protein ArsA (TC 3.A.4.1.1) [Desulfotomaculum arcticum] [Desulfotruncus arcticus DSM 17038]